MDIPSVVNANPPGTTFIIHPGVYRLGKWINPKDGDSFIGQVDCAPPKTSCPAILNGSKLLTGFQQSGSSYYVSGQAQHNYITIPTTRCKPGWEGCIYPEDLYFDNVPLQHVRSLAEVGTGTWFFDYSAKTIYFYDNPAGHTVETSVAEAAFAPGPANNVTVKNLTVEKFASPIMTGAIEGAGTGLGSSNAGANWVVESNEIRLNHANGVRVNFGWQVLNNYIHDNGNFACCGGVGGGNPDGSGTLASNVLVQGNEMAHNNYANVKPGFGAGGAKTARSRGFVFRGNYVHDNPGPGLWTDISNFDTLYDGNIVQDNADEGIFHEVSYGHTIVRNNKLLRNGYTQSVVGSGGYSANLESSTSQGVEAYCNTIEVSAQGGNAMTIIAANRGDDLRAPNTYYISSGNYFHHNTVSWDGTGLGLVAGVQYDSTNQPNFYSVNRGFDYNQYHLPSLSSKVFQWGGPGPKTFAYFQAQGMDTHGTADAKNTASVPNVTIISPADGSTVSGLVDITGNAPESVKLELYVDWTLKGTDGGGSPFSLTWNTDGTEAGPHTVAAMAYNRAGIRACYAITLRIP